MSEPPFYVHSEEFWGGVRQWAVFKRMPYPEKWRRVSKFFKKENGAEKLCARMNIDWMRYRAALSEGRDSADQAVTS